ncbi:MAG: hypothetical protein IPL54_11305 [Chitinophagaceae bacterium]|nr:hypothetical protein [Chitinophagaceae bacterium]
MVLESGHKQTVSVVIPTRKLNEITRNNLLLLISIFKELNIEHELILVSNRATDPKIDGVNSYYDDKNNAAFSRDAGIRNCSFDKSTYFFLDDDIILENGKIKIY